MNPKIFLVEDEQSLSKIISLNLQIEGYTVINCDNGLNAIKLFNEHKNQINLVLLDVMLPGINGFELCSIFKSISPKLPIIFITAKNQNAERINGLKLGADDYLVKPFELEELLLRIKNVLKRYVPDNTQLVFNIDKASINFQTFEIIDVRGALHTLSKREIGLLKLLTHNANKVISREEIIDQLWDKDENASYRTIDNYILNFRKYFETNSKSPMHFFSIRGVGYKFQS
jgi:two-component system alkaline phosphatase synthesis response regulator PhoP